MIRLRSACLCAGLLLVLLPSAGASEEGLALLRETAAAVSRLPDLTHGGGRIRIQAGPNVLTLSRQDLHDPIVCFLTHDTLAVSSMRSADDGCDGRADAFSFTEEGDPVAHQWQRDPEGEMQSRYLDNLARLRVMSIAAEAALNRRPRMPPVDELVRSLLDDMARTSVTEGPAEDGRPQKLILGVGHRTFHFWVTRQGDTPVRCLLIHGENRERKAVFVDRSCNGDPDFWAADHDGSGAGLTDLKVPGSIEQRNYRHQLERVATLVSAAAMAFPRPDAPDTPRADAPRTDSPRP